MNANISTLDFLRSRELVAQTTGDEALGALLDGPDKIAFYIGFDPTGASLHVGHLVTLMTVRHLAERGHRPIIIVGGGTALVGDPSERSEMRPMLDEATIADNVARIRGQIERLVPHQAVTVVNNAEWLKPLSYVDFLREVGRHFSVNRMLAMDAYKQRLAHGLSFIEFNYQLLQAYDYLHLSDRFQCQLELGGDDQWGNILAGVDLIRRMRSVRVEGLTVPLLTTASGAKMGKTAQGAAWLDAERLSTNDYYQFWINCDDADVLRFLRIFTTLPGHELSAEATAQAPINALKAILAFECTLLVHGADAATRAHQAAQGAFGGRSIPADVVPSSTIDRSAQSDVATVPTLALQAQALQQGTLLVDLLVTLGWCDSKNAARRLIGQKSVRLGETLITEPGYLITREDLPEGGTLVRAGKRRVHRLTVAGA